jgi:hypothetical protein
MLKGRELKMKCHYCNNQYIDIYVEDTDPIPVCRKHLDIHIESAEIAKKIQGNHD